MINSKEKHFDILYILGPINKLMQQACLIYYDISFALIGNQKYDILAC